jgi:hypothetical protein
MPVVPLISLKEVLEDMSKREVPFSITFITLDRKRKKGGEVIRIEKGIQSGSAQEVAQVTTSEKDNSLEANKVEVNLVHNKSTRPNHYKHRTRNIFICGTSQIRKVHIRLITEFNSKKVYY